MSIANNYLSFLGKGWSFPPSFNQNGASVEMVIDEVDIAQSLKLLLTTHVGERLMHPDFSCDLKQFQFAALSLDLTTSIQDAISNAVLKFESRIILNTVKVVEDKQQQGLLLITLDYTIRATNSRTNLVYPFYLQEADMNSQQE